MTTMQAFTPTPHDWVVPGTGKLTTAASIFLRDLWYRAGGASALTNVQLEELMTTQYATLYDQDAEPPTEAYLGHADPGTATSSALWRIQHLTFGAGGDVTITWADGDALFNNVWDDRAGLSYS